MNFLEKLNFLMQRNGLNRRSLAQISGVPYTTIMTFYKDGYSNAKLSTLQRLCDSLNVSLDYLCRDEITDPSYGMTDDTFHSDEQELLSIYRSLNSLGRETLLTTARAFSQTMKKTAAVG